MCLIGLELKFAGRQIFKDRIGLRMTTLCDIPVVYISGADLELWPELSLFFFSWLRVGYWWKKNPTNSLRDSYYYYALNIWVSLVVPISYIKFLPWSSGNQVWSVFFLKSAFSSLVGLELDRLLQKKKRLNNTIGKKMNQYCVTCCRCIHIFTI